MQKKPIFDVQNLDRNVKLEELETGLRMYYVLACPKNFPNLSFISKNKGYYQTTMIIFYGPNMSKRLDHAYHKLKAFTMLELANFKLKEQIGKVERLEKQFKLHTNYK